MSKCLITGTFDPPTRGHEYIVERALRVFDEVAVAILVNPDKHACFPAEERISMFREAFGDAIEVFYYEGWAVDAAKAVSADVLVRGIRGAADLEYEREMAEYNAAHGMDTIFFFAPESLSNVSSTTVRDALEKGADTKEYLSEGVNRRALAYMEGKNGGHSSDHR